MLAADLIVQHITPKHRKKAGVIAFVGDTFYHVHKDEEVPEGQVQIRNLPGGLKVGLYVGHCCK